MYSPSLQKIANEWIAAWNSHDLEAIMAHYDDNIIFTSHFIVEFTGPGNGTITDKSDLRHYFEIGLSKYPGLRFDLINALYGLNSMVLYYRSIAGLLSAEFMELNNEGKVFRVVAHYSKV